MSEFLVYFKYDEVANRMCTEDAVAALVWAAQSEEECYVTLQNSRGGLVACSGVGPSGTADCWVRPLGRRYDALDGLASRANALLDADEWAGARFEADLVPPESCSYRPDPERFPWWSATLTRTAETVRAAL